MKRGNKNFSNRGANNLQHILNGTRIYKLDFSLNVLKWLIVVQLRKYLFHKHMNTLLTNVSKCHLSIKTPQRQTYFCTKYTSSNGIFKRIFKRNFKKKKKKAKRKKVRLNHDLTKAFGSFNREFLPHREAIFANRRSTKSCLNNTRLEGRWISDV